jgi:dipeptidyl aminopeptidase/acylaminoacyl peptidase
MHPLSLPYVGVLVLALGLAGAVRIAVASYRGERSDFTRWPPSVIVRHPERTGIEGLREEPLSKPGEPRLASWYAPSRNTAAVVLVHGTGADRASLLPETRLLAAAGYGVLALDLPGQGLSDGRSVWGVPERQAIIAAAEWLATRPEVDANRIGGFGLSMGAYVLTQAAALHSRLRALILAGCPTDVIEQNWLASARWGWLSQLPNHWALRASGMPFDMMPKDIVGRLAPRSLLIIAGENDHAVPPSMAKQLYGAAGAPKELWIVTGAGHSDYAAVAPDAYAARLAGFYRATLLA